MEEYGQSFTFPIVYGEHSHLYTFDTDPDIRQLEIDLMKLRGTRALRENFMTGAAKYRLLDPTYAQGLMDFYTQDLVPDLLKNGVFPFLVLADRNWSGDWRSGTPFNLGSAQRDAIVDRVETVTTWTDNDRVFDRCNRIAINFAVFGSDTGSLCTDLREFLLDQIETIATACPTGTWFQLFNGPETTRVCGNFAVEPWDFTPDTMHVSVDPPNAAPEDNRDWAFNDADLEVTMPTVEADYIELEAVFYREARARVAAAGHPPDKLILGGIHTYVLSAATRRTRSLGAPDPMDFTTIPESAVFSEFGVGRYPDVELNDPDVLPRPFREHASRILSKMPRAMFLHSPMDARQLALWETPGDTLQLWTKFFYTPWLEGSPGRKPDVNVAYHLLEDEPGLWEEMLDAARRFGLLEHVRPTP